MSDLTTIESAGPDRDATRSPFGDRPWSRELLAGLGLLLLAFAPTVVSLPVLWWSNGDYVQGFPLAAMVAWVIWRDRRELLPPRAESPSELVVALGGLSALWLIFQIMSVQAGSQLMLVAILTTWALHVIGPASWPVLVPAGTTLLLTIPVLDSLIPILREMAVVMTGLFTRLLRIPAEIQGDVIIIEWGSFIIENGCAGYRYLLVGLTLGVMYSHLFMRGWKARIGVVALAGAVALLSNWIRITHLIWLGHATQMESPTITDHVVHGWIVFCIALIPFFALARWLERWNAPRDTAPGEGSPPVRSTPSPGAWRRRLTLATGVCVMGPLVYYVGSLMPSTEIQDLPIEPAGEGWVRTAPDGGGTLSPEWEIGYPEADRYEVSRWTREGGSTAVVGRRLVYSRQRQGAELINSLNRIAPDSMTLRQRTVGPVDSSGGTMRETWVRSGDEAWLVWHRYRVAGVTTSSRARAKLLEVLAFFTRRRQAELVTYAAPCGPESCEEAVGNLLHFVTGRELPR